MHNSSNYHSNKSQNSSSSNNKPFRASLISAAIGNLKLLVFYNVQFIYFCMVLCFLIYSTNGWCSFLWSNHCIVSWLTLILVVHYAGGPTQVDLERGSLRSTTASTRGSPVPTPLRSLSRGNSGTLNSNNTSSGGSSNVRMGKRYDAVYLFCTWMCCFFMLFIYLLFTVLTGCSKKKLPLCCICSFRFC